VPLILATTIYFVFRQFPPSLVGAIKGDSDYIQLASHLDIFVFNLPDGLWAFSFTSFILLATRQDTNKIRLIYLCASVILMIALEAFQGDWISGTYDAKDMVAIAIGIVSALICLKGQTKNAI
jgi:fucose 4-O-acetylase-like acetyltransferase